MIEHNNIELFVQHETGVPTLELGSGRTVISDIYTEDGKAGICFAIDENADKNDVWKEHPEITGKTTKEIGAFFQIFTSNVESLKVLKDKVDRAISHLTYE